MKTKAKTRMTSKGQVTVPKTVRDRLGLKPGDEIEFVEEDGIFTVRRVFDPEAFLKWQGYLKHLAGRDPDDLVNEMRGR
jgi:AbrB family looped-hinge helix DNA binding protein